MAKTQPKSFKEKPPQCARLDFEKQTLVFCSFDNRIPLIIYFGEKLPLREDLVSLAASKKIPIQRGTLDRVSELSLCPEEGRGFFGQPGLRLQDEKARPVFTQFELQHIKAVKKDFLTIQSIDAHLGLQLTHNFITHQESGVVKMSSELSLTKSPNPSDALKKKKYHVKWLCAPAIPLPQTANYFFEYAGRWSKEFDRRKISIERGVHLRENRRGRTGHDHFPAIIAPETTMTHTAEAAYGIHFGFSGTHRLIIEELSDKQRQVQFGIAQTRTLSLENPLALSGTTYCAFSKRGINGLAQLFQNHVRKHIVRMPKKRKHSLVHYNCWEAVYFDHKVEQLKQLATTAAKIGAERFVLDDGWFGNRNDDTSSLGDWEVNPKKFPKGLTPLIAHVKKCGMQFGLWVEPEMVNSNSKLAKAHPDWIIMPDNRKQLTGRNQHVLDLTNPKVIQYLFEKISALLSKYDISYLKWDMNRDLTLPADKMGNALLERQTRAVYHLLNLLTTKHPHVEIESCSSGGARLDYGILKYTHRVWLSDSNDAHERWLMQNEAFVFLPPELVGSHVGPAKCHTSGRILPLAFRSLVAMTGSMGFEMDLQELEEKEVKQLQHYTALYKKNRNWMHKGTQHRLDTAQQEVVAQMFLSDDRSHFFVFSATMDVVKEEATAPLKLSGLEEDQYYLLRIVNLEDLSHATQIVFDSPLVRKSGLNLSGLALMQSGIVLPTCFPDTMLLVEGQKIEKTQLL